MDSMPEEDALRFKDEFEQQIPMGRIAMPDEIAETIAFLASKRSSYCTASNLVVDGGIMG